MEVIETEIVDTKIRANKLLTFGFAILWLGATIYIFLLHDEFPNKYLSISSFIFYLIGSVILFKITFVKPKAIGDLRITEDFIEFNLKEIQKKFDLSALKKLTLTYSGYATWTLNFWGSKNYLHLEGDDGQSYKFEFLIKSKTQKENLKNIFKSPPIKDKFNVKPLNDYDLNTF
ncbi:MAG TPA: hypothetical protein DD671_09330 [Balneolaceae bacterium]|nr:hypothetical protein [Balneolaceae bacterium]